jgi:tetratricopeptide (TPR) repeat protein
VTTTAGLHPHNARDWTRRTLEQLRELAEQPALHEKGKVEVAIACYHRAILDPKHAYAHHNLGTPLHGKGQVDEAIEGFRTAIASDPKYAYAHATCSLSITYPCRTVRQDIEFSDKDRVARVPAEHGLSRPQLVCRYQLATDQENQCLCGTRRALHQSPIARRPSPFALNAPGQPSPRAFFFRSLATKNGSSSARREEIEPEAN